MQDLDLGVIELQGISSTLQTAVPAVQANSQKSINTLRTAAAMITRMLQPLHSTVLPAHAAVTSAVVARNPGHLLVRSDLSSRSAVLSVQLSLPGKHSLPNASSSTVIVLPAARAAAGVLPALPPAAVQTAAQAVQLNSPPYDALQALNSKVGELLNSTTVYAALQGQLVAYPSSYSSMIIKQRTVGSLQSCQKTLQLAAVLERQSAVQIAVESPGLAYSSTRGSAVLVRSRDRYGGNYGSGKQHKSDYSRYRPHSQPPAASGGSHPLAPPAAFLKLARMGIALMGLAAAAAVSAVVFSTPRRPEGVDTASNNSQGGDSATARDAAAAGVEYDGPGYHEWMEMRLQAALQQFSAEYDMLKAELAMLQALSKKMNSNSSHATGHADSSIVNAGGVNVFARIRRFFTNRSQIKMHSSSSSNLGSATTGLLPAEMTEPLTPTGISSRIAEIREQLESIDVLKAALTAELVEQQRPRR